MHITHRQIASFVQLAQSSTFAEAAEKMHLTQPALSAAIKKLEEQVGGQLFSRSTRKVVLSPEGQEFLPVAVRLLNDWADAIADINNLFALQRGKLSIAAMPSFAGGSLPGILRKYIDKWPNINISVLDVVMEEVIHLVREGRVELGFTFENEQLDGLEFIALQADQFVAVIPSDSALVDKTDIDWEVLSAQKFIAMNRGSSIRRWVDATAKEVGYELDIVAEAGQLTTVGEMVRQGLGVSVVPGICQQQMALKGLVIVPLQSNPIVRQLGIIRSSRKSLSVPAQAMWDLVTEL